jgi:Anaphase-promoting complex subunit 1
VVWSAGRIVRKRFTTSGGVLSAAWARFEEGGPEAVLCLLQPLALMLYTLEGEAQCVPLPAAFSTLWALPKGLMLTVRTEQALQVAMLPK